MKNLVRVGWTMTLALGAIGACGGSSTSTGNDAGNQGEGGGQTAAEAGSEGGTAANPDAGSPDASSCIGAAQMGMQGGTACNACLQANCQSDLQCATTMCSDYANCACSCASSDTTCLQGCLPKQTAACMGCLTQVVGCALQACSSSCLANGDSGLPVIPEGGLPFADVTVPQFDSGIFFDASFPIFDSGFTFPDIGVAPTGSCNTLTACCAQLSSPGQAICQAIAGTNVQQACAAALANLQDAGSCH
jgi:hypothetical protein